jgi:thioredoxin-related protein
MFVPKVMNMKMKLNACVALMALSLTGLAFAGGEGWTADLTAAKKQAGESNKDLLMDFTGSDWCGWCIKLDKEVFSLEPFKTGVKDKFVLVEVDFPKDKSKLSEETIKQNDELGKKYGIEGYPTILLTDASGKPFAATGYKEGGPELYVTHLDELRAKKVTRDESLKAAENAKGVDKAKALIAALKAMELNDTIVSNYYGDVVEQIKASDPKDETGFVKEAAAKERLAKFQQDLSELAQKQDFDGALVLVDKTIKEGGFPTDETQQLMATRGMIFAQQKKFDEAIKAVDEAKAFAPDCEIASSLEGFKKRLEEGRKKAEGGDKTEEPEAK